MSNKQRTRKLLKAVVLELNRGNWDLWNILSALRGPDHKGPFELKRFTTARIRAVVGMRICNDLFVSCMGLPLSKDEMEQRDYLLKRGSSHFHSHYRTAVGALQTLYGYALDAERPVFDDKPMGVELPVPGVCRLRKKSRKRK